MRGQTKENQSLPTRAATHLLIKPALPPEVITDRSSQHIMVSAFRRSVSFPILSSFRPSSSSPEKSPIRHLRSSSLPSRFHPLVSQLNRLIHNLRLWHSEQTTSLAWLVDGLVWLDHVQDSFAELLNLQNTDNTLRPSCRGSNGWSDRLLDDFLRLSDAYGTFRSAVVALQQNHSATQAAIRGRSDSWIASCARSKRRMEKELARLASAVHHVSRSPTIVLEDAAQAEFAGIMREVTMVTATTSAAVFMGIAEVSRATTVTASPWSRISLKLSRRLGRGGGEEKKRWGDFEELEESMRALEEKSDRLFRSLVNTRVSLLNILSHSL